MESLRKILGMKGNSRAEWVWRSVSAVIVTGLVWLGLGLIVSGLWGMKS